MTIAIILALVGFFIGIPFFCIYGGSIIPRYTWEHNDTGITITGVYGWRRDVVVPDTIRGYPVTQIGRPAPETIIVGGRPEPAPGTRRERLEAVFAQARPVYATAPSRIGLFYRITGTQNIRTVTLPDTVTHIGVRAFDSLDNLESIYLPDGLVYIGDRAFRGCSGLREINLPDSVVHIGESAFESCLSLTEVILPVALTEVNRDVFRGCTNLGYIAIPDGITEIGRGAFAMTGIKEIDIPINVTYIGGSAFARANNLESITIPPGITTIYGNTFYNATNLRYVYYSDTLKRVGHNAFTGTPWLEEGGFEIMKQQLRDWGEQ